MRLTNSGSRAGDEVPQLLRPAAASPAVTGKRLQAYRRVHLAAGESRVIEVRAAGEEPSRCSIAQDRWTRRRAASTK
mgnify:CR=1 FL=1